MKVIVRIQAGKFFDGRRSIRPELGDVIDLPDHIAKKEIESGYAFSFKENTKQRPPKKAAVKQSAKKKKKEKVDSKPKRSVVKKKILTKMVVKKKKKKRTPVT